MTTYQKVLEAASVPSGKTRASFFSTIQSLVQRLGRWVNDCADHYAAAALYDELRRLSDAELHKRGLSRDTLARDVAASCERTHFP